MMHAVYNWLNSFARFNKFGPAESSWWKYKLYSKRTKASHSLKSTSYYRSDVSRGISDRNTVKDISSKL